MFYLLAPLGFFIFIKPLAINKKQALYYGCIMGFLMYSTFDLTNKAIFSDYTWNYAVKDVIWGKILVSTKLDISLYLYNISKN